MPETSPIYNQVQSPALYQLSSSSQSGAPGWWGGYLPSQSAAFGATATLTQVWNDTGGVYLFANQTPSDYSTFLAALQAVLRVISPTGAVRFLWIANPNDAWQSWQTSVLLATASGSPVTWTVPRQAIFALGNYAVQINAGAALTQSDPGTLGYGISVNASSLMFLSSGGAWTATAGSAWIPLAGAAVGAIAATISMPSSGGDGFAALGAGLRYTVPAPNEMDDNNVQPIAMPVLQQGSVNVTLYLSFDPLNPLLPARTQLAFFQTGSPTTLPALNATFVTTLGYSTTLQPLAPAAPLWGARLVFCSSPLYSSPGAGINYYLAPDGAFALTTSTPQELLARAGDSAVVERVPPGLSGLEYVGLAAVSGTVVLFQAGQPAYAPNALLDSSSADLDNPSLTNLGTTSYVAFLPPTSGATGLPYFAQPRQAPLYVAGSDLGTGFMDFHEMPAATLPSWGSGLPTPTVFPAGIYSAIDPSLARYARVLERAALAPARRAAIGLPTVEESLRADDDPPPPLAVTPQGLIAVLNSDETQWAGVMVANLTGAPALTLAPVGPPFQAALQSNELFMVVSNVDTFMNSSSVSYQLTPATLALLPAAGVPQTVVTQLNTLLSPSYPVFPTETAFVQAIQSVAGTYIPQILPVAGLLKVSLDGWMFQVSPRSWRTGANKPTVMMFKYCNRALEEMVADTGTWAWQAAAADNTGDLKPTQKLIQDIFASAAQAAAGTPYARFYNQVVRNPYWNGVLFLNTPISTAELPNDLQFVTAGINPAEFYAHHVGFSLTPFDLTSGTIAPGQTAVFALIDYQDPKDLYLTETVPFAFKTLAFTARFANAALAEFSSRVELMINRLFGSELARQNAQHGNNLILNGGYQRQNGVPFYAFTLESANRYDTAASALASVEVLGAQIQTAASTSTAGTVGVDFVLSGNLRFIELPVFDLFSWGVQTLYPAGGTQQDGYLRFGNLVVNMSFPLSSPATQTFTVYEQRVSFDAANSVARPLSLVRNFPVRLAGLTASANLAAPGETPEGQRPEDMGFTSISAPISQSLLSPPWYGLVFTLDLGTLGALAGSIGLSITMLAAWANGIAGAEPPVFLGLQLPDAKSLGLDLPLQGVLRLGFRNFLFEASGTTTTRSYMLRLRRLALSILGWSFPPGNADVYVLGNDQGDPSAVVGWYAAYSGPDEKKNEEQQKRLSAQQKAARRLRSGRRALPPAAGM